MRAFILSFFFAFFMTLGIWWSWRVTYRPALLTPPARPRPAARISPSPAPGKTTFSPDLLGKTPERIKTATEHRSFVAEFYAPWFQTMASVDPAAMKRQRILLNELINTDSLAPLIEDPAWYAPLALSSAPRDLAMLLASNGENLRPVAEVLLTHTTPGGFDDFAAILNRDLALISKLHARNLVGVEVIFAYDHDSEAGREYDRWQRDILNQGIRLPAEHLASLINLQLLHGGEIRARMAKDKKFLTRFRGELWPAMARLAADHRNMYDIFLDTPRIWDLLLLPEGEQLIKAKGPLVPIDLLYGFPAVGHQPYPKEIHPDIIRTLLSCDEITVSGLMKFRSEPEFIDLIKRDLPPELLSAISQRLLKDGADYPRRLKEFSRMSDAGLSEEIGPPPSIIKIWTPFYFTLWDVPRKLAHGRRPKVFEWINSIADPASFILPVVKIGTAGINLVKSITGHPANKTSQSLTLQEQGRRLAEKELGRDLSQALSKEQLYSFGVTGMLRKILEKKPPDTPGTMIDHSGAIRFFMAYSGADSAGLKLLDRYQLHFVNSRTGPMQVVPGKNLDPQLGNFFSNTARQCLLEDIAVSCSRNQAAWWLLMAGGINLSSPGGGRYQSDK